MLPVAPEVKKQLKEQRLRNLSTLWYDRMLDKVAFEARGDVDNAKRVEDEMAKIEKSYQAIEQLPTE